MFYIVEPYKHGRIYVYTVTSISNESLDIKSRAIRQGALEGLCHDIVKRCWVDPFFKACRLNGARFYGGPITRRRNDLHNKDESPHS